MGQAQSGKFQIELATLYRTTEIKRPQSKPGLAASVVSQGPDAELTNNNNSSERGHSKDQRWDDLIAVINASTWDSRILNASIW